MKSEYQQGTFLDILKLGILILLNAKYPSQFVNTYSTISHNCELVDASWRPYKL